MPAGKLYRAPAKEVSKPVKKAIKKAIDASVEEECFDVVASYAAGQAGFSTAGSVACLSNIALGDDIGTRKGTTVRAKYLDMNLIIEAVQSTASGNIFTTGARVIVFQDHQNTGTTPTVAQVLLSGGATQYNSHIERNAWALGRYRILFDKMVDMAPDHNYIATLPGNSSFSDTSKYVWRKRMKLHDSPLSFIPAGAFSKNAIFILFISDQATAAAPAYYYDTRLVYTDA